MRTAGLSIFTTLLGLHALSTQAQTACHANNPLTWSISDLDKLQDVLKGPVIHLCSRGIEHEGDEIITYETKALSFQISRTITQSFEECKASFATIINQCIAGMNVGGGVVEGKDGVFYEIFDSSREDDGSKKFRFEKRSARDLKVDGENDDFGDLMESQVHGNLDTRAPKVKAKKPAAKKPATKPQANKPKPTLKPAAKTKSQSVKASKTSASIKADPTKTCDQLYALAIASREKEALGDQKRGAEAKSQGFVGSRIQIERRASKSALACRTNIKALNYPDAREMPATAKFYGFTKPNVCDVFGFSSSARPTRDINKNYQIEHVLEWQTVTYFFDWVNKKMRSDTPRFDNPDPKSKGGKPDFCGYWKGLWLGASQPSFSIDNSVDRTPSEHLKFAYPGIISGNFNHGKEFVWLHKLINAPAKSNMWSHLDNKIGVYEERKKIKEIEGASTGKAPNKIKHPAEIDTAKEALLDLKYLIGARKYMRNPAIAAIFRDQKVRIGDILDKLDTELPKHARQHKTLGTLEAWKPQQLKKFWDQYMDERFNVAVLRTNHDMDTYLALLRKEWAVPANNPDQSQRAFFGLIKKIELEWKKEKAIKWTAPW